MKITPNNEYRTRDIGEAASLLTYGLDLIRFDRNDQIVWFVFLNSIECQDYSHRFWFGELLVNAKTFHEALKTLKNRIFRGGV